MATGHDVADSAVASKPVSSYVRQKERFLNDVSADNYVCSW
jgi:hypothetical protein